MSKLKLLSVVLIFAFIYTACSDSGSNTTSPDPEPIEPTLTVSGPMQGDVVEGEVTLSISGEAEEGFSEARLFVGDQQIETISDPSLPIEDTIATYNYHNGDYELRAEVDVTGMDTTLTKSISVTLENYFFELETSDYISSYQNTNLFLFIADPEGKVLREVNLTARGDGTLQLLPPQAFEGDVPNSFSMTFGYQSIQRGEEVFELYSDAGLTPWSDFQINLEESEPSTSSLSVAFNNFPQNLLNPIPFGQDSKGHFTGFDSNTDDIKIASTAKEALFTIYSSFNPEEANNPNVPLYYLEKNIQDSLSTTDSLRYDVSENFKPMEVHLIGFPSGYRSSSVTTHIESSLPFNDGSYYVLSYGYPYGTSAEDQSRAVVAAVPNIEGRKLGFATSLSSTNSSKHIYIQKGGLDALPQQFGLPADQNFVTVNNSSLDDITLEALNTNSSVDFIELIANHPVTTSNGFNIEKQRWVVTLRDTTSSFIFPSIGDSLSPSVSAYNRSELELRGARSYDFDSYDGFDDYINQYYGQTTDLPFEYIRWSTSVDQGSSTKARKKERSILDKGRRNHLIPPYSKNH